MIRRKIIILNAIVVIVLLITAGFFKMGFDGKFWHCA